MRSIPVHQPDESERGRTAARLFEQALPPERRKRLGQFFTGIRLGKLLSHLAISRETRTVLDPMAGHGDLLDAITEVAHERDIRLNRLDGIEIDDETATVCRLRLKTITGSKVPEHSVVCGNAFDAITLNQLDDSGYDLVITNPPYVRYQAQNGSGRAVNATRNGLISAIEARLLGHERVVWQTLAGGYSGLADLSVPSWILSGLLVRPGGRLALVVPATWRTRDYGDVIRYMMLRCFALEIIVEDTQPGWFSNALVRTQLIVARRLTIAETEQRLSDRAQWAAASSISISPEAANQSSLVGTAFRGPLPEKHFAQWLTDQPNNASAGVKTQAFNLNDEWRSLRGRAKPRLWLLKLEETKSALPLFREKTLSPSVPEAVQAVVGDDLKLSSLMTLEGAGLSIGQGLRTGCNRFFYVEALGFARDGVLLVKGAEGLGHCEFEVPASAVRPVLRKQSELPLIERGQMPAGRVLDLRNWALPEDMETVAKATATYRASGEAFPQPMPHALADFVRRAAITRLDEVTAKFAPELSAVRTNIRAHREGCATPRFWYMLPDFKPRHVPAAFVGRVNNGTPWVECNFDNPFLVDANFSTFWSLDNKWSRFALKALLNSAWCRLFMEALGTPLGGGALKLEAAHLRQLLIPALSEAAHRELDQAGRSLKQTSDAALCKIDGVIFTALRKDGDTDAARSMAESMIERAETLRRMRQRAAA
jgi:N-6 DNA Methylase